MSERTYRIHELAALASVTVKALHHYDRVGLLKPRRTASRYRLYTTRDLTRLQQILALRSLGLPLRRIRDLLAPGAPPLHLALRQQRQVLQDQRRLLDRTIRALGTAEASLEASPDCASDALRALLEVTNMPDSVDEMRKYYSDEVWDSWRHHYEDWPSPAWRALFHDINRALDARWRAILDGECGGDEEIASGQIRAWRSRRQWAPGFLRYMASCYEMDAATWLQVADFLESGVDRPAG